MHDLDDSGNVTNWLTQVPGCADNIVLVSKTIKDLASMFKSGEISVPSRLEINEQKSTYQNKFFRVKKELCKIILPIQKVRKNHISGSRYK